MGSDTEIKRSAGRRILRTFLTLAELISPFRAMLSMSSTLVEPLHLQAMIGENGGGSLNLRASRRNRRINPFRTRNSGKHSHGNVTCQTSPASVSVLCFLLTATTPPVGLSPTMAVGQPTRPRYQRPVQPHQLIPGGFYLTKPPSTIPTGNVHVLVASLSSLVTLGVFIQSWRFSPGKFQTVLL